MRSLTFPESLMKPSLHTLLATHHKAESQDNLYPEVQAIFKFEENFAKFRDTHRSSLGNLIKAFGSLDSGPILEQIYNECLISLKETITNEVLFHSEVLEDKKSTAASFIENWINQTDFPLVGIICWVKGIEAGKMIIESKSMQANFAQFLRTHGNEFKKIEDAVYACANKTAINNIYEACQSEIKSRFGLDKVAANLDGADVDEVRDYKETLDSLNTLPVVGLICWIKGVSAGVKEIEKCITPVQRRLKLV